MSTTAYKYAGTTASVDRDAGIAWTNPDNTKIADGNFASVLITAKSNYSDWLRLTNFGFIADDVPEGATINGIEVAISRKCSSSNSGYDSAIYLRNSFAVQVGDNKASATKWPTSNTEVSYGGVADGWNADLTQADIIDSNFGIDISVDTTVESTDYIDYVKIRITYTPPSSATMTGISTITGVNTITL